MRTGRCPGQPARGGARGLGAEHAGGRHGAEPCIHVLHMLILWVCVAIAVAVFGVMIYSIVKFRRSQGAVAANFDHSTRAAIWRSEERRVGKV